jgi:hypothetical protein
MIELADTPYFALQNGRKCWLIWSKLPLWTIEWTIVLTWTYPWQATISKSHSLFTVLSRILIWRNVSPHIGRTLVSIYYTLLVIAAVTHGVILARSCNSCQFVYVRCVQSVVLWLNFGTGGRRGPDLLTPPPQIYLPPPPPPKGLEPWLRCVFVLPSTVLHDVIWTTQDIVTLYYAYSP